MDFLDQNYRKCKLVSSSPVNFHRIPDGPSDHFVWAHVITDFWQDKIELFSI